MKHNLAFIAQNWANVLEPEDPDNPVSYIDWMKCVSCGLCTSNCTAKAVTVLTMGYPYINPLFCKNQKTCQRICPNKAITTVGYTPKDEWLCQLCGHVTSGTEFKNLGYCPLCGSPIDDLLPWASH